MKYSLSKKHKILCLSSAIVFAVWMITTAILKVVLDDIGDKYVWAIGMDIFWSAIAIALIINPIPKIFSKNLSADTEEIIAHLRRNMLCGILLVINICCFAMALCHNIGITDLLLDVTLQDNEFIIDKVGFINLFGMIMMIAIACLAIKYATVSKSIIFKDKLDKRNNK